VRGAAKGDAESSAGWARFFHWLESSPWLRKKRVWQWPDSSTDLSLDP
jgi:hypothetical protein